jgi:predicted CXXCH cytochrome family protein
VLATVFVAVLLATPALARVSGPCANCHTMHNSQDGGSMADPAQVTVNSALLVAGCVGCHTANDGSTWKNSVGAPIVYNTSAPTYGPDAGDGQKQGLAAGNFYFVDQDDTFGHNIFTQDANLDYPPGWRYGCENNNECHVNLHRVCTNTTGGYYGKKACEKCHMLNANVGRWHHANDSGLIKDTAAEGYYRFLSSHGSEGVAGIEDPFWEHEATSAAHNEYLGTVGDKRDDGPFTEGLNTVTSFCVGCHNSMHIQDSTYVGASPWLRHPSDQRLPAGGEYAGYTVYDPLVPVARPGLSTVRTTVTQGQDMVMCLSCHRAHGSPYPDMLRFPYDGMQAGGGGADGTGCFKCHTGKDGS